MILDHTNIDSRPEAPADVKQGKPGDWAKALEGLTQWRNMMPDEVITLVVLPFAHEDVPTHWRTDKFTARIQQGGGSYFRTMSGEQVDL